MKLNYKSVRASLAAYNLVFILGLSISMSACDWGDQIESLVQPNQDDFAVLFSDTSTVLLSTVITDSVMTGSAQRMLVGRYVDPYFGKIQTSTFFQPGTQSSVTVAQEAVYDSLIFSIYYDRYTYGDTTKPLNLTIHKLLTDLATDKNAYFNSNSTAYEPTPIGRATVVPSPRRQQRLVIRLSDVLGKDIFAKAKTNQIPSNTEWINLVKGLVLRNAPTDNGAIVGFITASAALQMHYHTPRADGVSKDSTVFNNNALYNQVLTDRTGTPTANLPVTKRLAQPSAATGNMSFVQAGPGLMTRVDLPYLRGLKNIKYTASNKAFLRITPKRQSVTNLYRAPDSLVVYRVDKNNEFYLGQTGFPLPLLSLGSQVPAYGRYIVDMVTNREYYLIDISSYVTELLASETGDVGGLILRTSQFNEQLQRYSSTTYPALGTTFTNSFNRLVIGDQQSDDPGVKLELYYTTIKVQ
ncbi:DUF4270 family protein [Dyadobacter sp. CY343]|uniref:DUF4270 family protein n=1 Tax=Dyadobacter sp. CY343 TaxID=2907299 RepID=UPI001F456FC3|nr:DUF4270 family protein [Dyadobacter sp. CY343]MCE7059688.1 DUF4270 domain-containing protein [Dyadobacter sp. CY343]